MYLINNGNYSAAISLLPDTDEPDIKNLRSILTFGDYRLDFRYKEIGNIGREKFSNYKVPKIIADYKCSVLNCNFDYLNIFGGKEAKKKEYAFRTTELLSIAKFYLKIGKLSDFVLALAIFIEQFFNSFITSHTGIDITISDPNNRTKVLNLVKQKYPDILEGSDIKVKFDISTTKLLSLPLTIAFSTRIAKLNNNEVSILIIKLLTRLNKNFKGCIVPIDDLRNDIAHRGEGVKPDEIMDLLNENIIEKIDNLIGTQKYFPFFVLNQEIIAFIKEKF